MGSSSGSPVFQPHDEPYLGLEVLVAFDNLIVATMEANTRAASWTRDHSELLTPLQRAACEVIPQAVGIALSIRELIRQAYLFSALVLMRPLVERAAIISYLDDHPEAVVLWQSGWKHGSRPSLATMLSSMAPGAPAEDARAVCAQHNHLVHGDPLSAFDNLICLPDGSPGFANGKMLDNPRLAEEIAAEALCYMVILLARITTIFPSAAPEA